MKRREEVQKAERKIKVKVQKSQNIRLFHSSSSLYGQKTAFAWIRSGLVCETHLVGVSLTASRCSDAVQERVREQM